MSSAVLILLLARLALALPSAVPVEAAVAAVLDDWHAAAAAADEVRYFGHFAPGANDATKRLLLGSLTMPREKLLDRAAMDFAACLRGEEGREGVSAFLEKRASRWASRSREGL